MKEIKANFWDVYLDYDVICVTTNGVTKLDGSLVMGAGIALDFKLRFQGLDKILGKLVKEKGNKVHLINFSDQLKIASFPTKYNYASKSSLYLIENSCTQILDILKDKDIRILLPRPGCQNGGLNWEFDVQPLLKLYLDDRFYIISK